MSERLRTRREVARASASSLPSRHLRARSPLASDPRWVPTATSTRESVSEACSRVRSPRTARRGHNEGLFDLTQPSGHGAIFCLRCDIKAAGPRSCSAQRRALSPRLRADRRP